MSIGIVNQIFFWHGWTNMYFIVVYIMTNVSTFIYFSAIKNIVTYLPNKYTHTRTRQNIIISIDQVLSLLQDQNLICTYFIIINIK